MPSLAGRTTCEKCYLSGVASLRLRSYKDWPILKEIFDRQGGLCPYSGIPLTLGINTSLDHRIPRSKGGTDAPDNLQWVFHHVNTMKWDLTEEEFLEVFRTILSFQRICNS